MVTNKFRCPFCINSFKSLRSMYSHVEDEHKIRVVNLGGRSKFIYREKSLIL